MGNFNPIAQPKHGETEIQRRVWDAENVKIAYEAYEKGVPLIAAPFITGEPWLRKPRLLYEWNEHELAEVAKCSQDICYFAQQYCQLYRPDGTYGLVDWRPYQLTWLKRAIEEKYLLWCASRQCSKTTTNAVLLLWLMTFYTDYKCAVLGDRGSTSAENLTKVRDIYIRLPFFLKAGVTRSNLSVFAFDNGSSMITGPTNLTSVVGKSFRCVFTDECGLVDDREYRPFFEFTVPTISNLFDGKYIMTSSPKQASGVFYETYTKAKLGKSPFWAMETHWDEIPGRDEKWKQDQIDIMGETAFLRQYDCLFLASEDAWLSPEIMDHLQKLSIDANYVNMLELTDNERAIANMAKVEKAIMKSKYRTKATIMPKRKLLQCATFDSNYVKSLNDLKNLPIIIVIDTGEGKGTIKGDLADYTTAHFYLPRYGNEQAQLVQEAYKAEIAEIEMAAKQDAGDYDDEDAALDAMCDVEEVDADALTNDYLMVNGVQCVQIGNIASNEHAIPMFALFIQLFVYYFLNPEKTKILCELDGIGSKMQALLATDIIANLGVEFETFAHADPKGGPGIYMRGKNKRGYVYDAQQYIENGQIVPTYGGAIYELGKFQEVKAGVFQGVDAHDDHVMPIVMLGGYMKSEDFATFIDENLMPDDEPMNEDGDDDPLAGIV